MKAQPTRFYLIITILLLVVVLLGFGRTFFLRPFFDQPPHLQTEQLPFGIMMHGLLMTLWFVCLVLQSVLINTKNANVHMRLGWGLAALAVLMVIFGVPVMMGFAPRMLAFGLLDLNVPEQVWIQNAMWTNDLTALAAFIGLVTIGILNRKNKVLHRTMMLFGSMAFTAPASFRMYDWIAPEFAMPGMILTFILFPLSLLVHDWVYGKGFPKYAFWGFWVLVLVIVLTLNLPNIEFWKEIFLQHLK